MSASSLQTTLTIRKVSTVFTCYCSEEKDDEEPGDGDAVVTIVVDSPEPNSLKEVETDIVKDLTK